MKSRQGRTRGGDVENVLSLQFFLSANARAVRE